VILLLPNPPDAFPSCGTLRCTLSDPPRPPPPALPPPVGLVVVSRHLQLPAAATACSRWSPHRFGRRGHPRCCYHRFGGPRHRLRQPPRRGVGALALPVLRAREYSGHLPLGGMLSTTESLRRRWGCEVKKERKALLGSSLYIIA
jgi:hypothetical protein